MVRAAVEAHPPAVLTVPEAMITPTSRKPLSPVKPNPYSRIKTAMRQWITALSSPPSTRPNRMRKERHHRERDWRYCSHHPAAGQTSLNVTIKAQTLDLLVKENVRQFTVATDHLVSVNIGLDTLKQLDTASAGGTSFSGQIRWMHCVPPRPKPPSAQDRPMTCHWSTSPAAKKHRLQLKWSHYIGAFALHTGKGEQTGNLYAVYVDDAGKVKWITKSSYDCQPESGCL